MSNPRLLLFMGSECGGLYALAKTYGSMGRPSVRFPAQPTDHTAYAAAWGVVVLVGHPPFF